MEILVCLEFDDFGSARLRDRKPRWVRGNLNFLYDALAEDFQGSKWGHPVVV
jgi:hypothetical protein